MRNSTQNSRFASLVTMLFALTVAGCGAYRALMGKDGPPTTTLESLSVIAETNANSNSATALDVLFVYDASSVTLLPANAPAWFAQKGGLMNTLARNVDVVSLQIPPPYQLPAIDMPERHRRAIRVLAYANYLAPAGQAPIDLTAYRHAQLTLRLDRIERGGT